MPFAMSIPGWNSLDSVRRIHSDLEFVAIVFFALLVLFEVLAFVEKEHTKKTLLEKIGLWFFSAAVLAELIAYPYGQRNDTLSEGVIGSLDVKAQRAADNASKSLNDSSTALAQSKDASGQAKDALSKAEGAKTVASSALGTANHAGAAAEKAIALARLGMQSASELAEKVKFRHVSPEQAGKIKSALLASVPGLIDIEVRPNADDGDIYCRELWDAIHSGGWTGTFGTTTLMYSQAHDLVLIVKNPNNAPLRAGALRDALKSADITVLIGRDPDLGDNDLILLVAPKPK